MRFPFSFIRPLLLLRAALLWLLLTNLRPGAVAADIPPYPGDVVRAWLAMQLRLGLNAPGGPPMAPRRFAYTGIALYEAIAPGFPAYQSLAPQLNGLPALPVAAPNARYYWPACANAALAAMSRALYPATSNANKAAIDSLEEAVVGRYRQEQSAEELSRSLEFGKRVATVVFAWSKTDGSDNTAPYTPVVGTGLWVPTPPAFAAPVMANWRYCRPFVADSDAGTSQGAPVSFSTDSTSAYFAQAQEIYTISQHLTDEQRAIALFWNTNSWNSVLSQVLAREQPSLEKAAVAFALLNITMADAAICISKGKYQHNGMRPVTYIRTVLKHPTWNPLLPTPPHPEYPGGHSVTSGAAAEVLTQLFGPNYSYTDTPYGQAGFRPRHYRSFEEAAMEASLSRVYGGIHYRKTDDMSLVQGKKIAQNVIRKLKFKS